MKYNEKYDRYIDDDLVIYRWDKKLDKLVPCSLHKTKGGYLQFSKYRENFYIHRFVWETFIGEIPEGYEIDHINTIKTDNRLENLRLVTHEENMNNPLTKRRQRESHLGKVSNRKGKHHSQEARMKISKSKKGKIRTIFAQKFYEHYKLFCSDNKSLYKRENSYFIYHGKCSWE